MAILALASINSGGSGLFGNASGNVLITYAITADYSGASTISTSLTLTSPSTPREVNEAVVADTIAKIITASGPTLSPEEIMLAGAFA